ncbi:hypothetical protein PBY51_004581 [Eleginops maclovinus]|uniref:Uncharacterized protein n=1 Tax=Eleginops maclovinus TaxID=56733 RepID=A0AAN7Y317_ELEMC|nr:hypothetical protein PBY51_004581 [Eleginops maclovinus]
MKENKPALPILQMVSIQPPEPPVFLSGFRGVSSPHPPLRTAGNSASFCCCTHREPGTLRMLSGRSSTTPSL